MPCGQRNERLDRKIKLGAEPASDRSRNNAHRLGSDPENLCDIGAIHIRGLGAGLNLDSVVYSPGKTGFRFDVGVFDEASLVFVFDNYVSFCQRFFHVAANHAASDQHIVLAARVDAFGIGGERRRNRSQRRQFFPCDRETCIVQSFDGFGFADDCGDGFTSKSGFNFGKYRLVGKTRNYAITILSRECPSRSERGEFRDARR